MRRRRTQQIVVAFIVVGFVGATFGLVTNPTDDAAPSTTFVRPDLDEAACRDDIERITDRLAVSFDAVEADAAANITDDDWAGFFEGIAAHCVDVGAAVSEVIMFATERTDATDDPVDALAPALTAAQLCNVGLPLTGDAQLACASADDLMRFDDLVPTTTG